MTIQVGTIAFRNKQTKLFENARPLFMDESHPLCPSEENLYQEIAWQVLRDFEPLLQHIEKTQKGELT